MGQALFSHQSYETIHIIIFKKQTKKKIRYFNEKQYVLKCCKSLAALGIHWRGSQLVLQGWVLAEASWRSQYVNWDIKVEEMLAYVLSKLFFFSFLNIYFFIYVSMYVCIYIHECGLFNFANITEAGNQYLLNTSLVWCHA